MKKLLAVMLVLGVASVASAAITLDPAMDGVVLMPSETVTIPILSDGGLLGMNVAVTVEGPGSIMGAKNGTGWDPGFSFDPVVEPGMAVLGAGNFNGNMDQVVGTIEIHCDGEGDVIVTIIPDSRFGGSSDMNFGTPEIGGSIVIKQVPEPMTMSLLGLGGLALIRRRRA